MYFDIWKITNIDNFGRIVPIFIQIKILNGGRKSRDIIFTLL